MAADGRTPSRESDGRPTTYEEAVEKRAEMIDRVRCLLVVEATDDEIWALWRAMAAGGPTSAFDVTKALNADRPQVPELVAFYRHDDDSSPLR